MLAQVVRLEQYYESNTVILGLAGERAQLMEKFGIDRLDDELLEAEVTIRVSAGLGVGDPAQRLQKFQSAFAVAGPILAQSREFQSGQLAVDVESVMDEVFGAAGYRDGGKRFVKHNPPAPQPPPPPQAALMLQKLLADIDKTKAQADNARLTGLAAVARAKTADRQAATSETAGLMAHHRARTDQALQALDMGHRHGAALAAARAGMMAPPGLDPGPAAPPMNTNGGGAASAGATAIPRGLSPGAAMQTPPPPMQAAPAGALPMPAAPMPGGPIPGGPPPPAMPSGQAPQIQRGPDGLATGIALPSPQASEQALALLAQLLTGQHPKQREVELLREQGRVAGARLTEPDGRVRHFAFQRGPDGRIAAAQTAMPGGLVQAPDGNHYLPDPNRPGKYLMLQRGPHHGAMGIA